MTDPEFDEPVSMDRTAMAAERTRIASERTLMAWIRTSLSLITFGFSIPKFFDFLSDATNAEPSSERLLGPQLLGLVLLALGVVCLLVAAYEHYRLMQRVTRLGQELRLWSLAMVMTLLVAAVGIFGMLSILF